MSDAPATPPASPCLVLPRGSRGRSASRRHLGATRIRRELQLHAARRAAAWIGQLTLQRSELLAVESYFVRRIGSRPVRADSSAGNAATFVAWPWSLGRLRRAIIDENEEATMADPSVAELQEMAREVFGRELSEAAGGGAIAAACRPWRDRAARCARSSPGCATPRRRRCQVALAGLAADELTSSPSPRIAELAPRLAAQEISPVELTDAVLARIERLDPPLNAFITVTAESARHAARAAEAAIMAGHHLGPLHGIPVALKDLYATRGVATTYGSPLFADWVPDFDAAAVERLKRAGAVILGKTNLHELAYGTTSANAHYGPVRNPWRQDHHPGGSSGGSAAAVAAGLAYCRARAATPAPRSASRRPAAASSASSRPSAGSRKFGALPLVLVAGPRRPAHPQRRATRRCCCRCWRATIRAIRPRPTAPGARLRRRPRRGRPGAAHRRRARLLLRGLRSRGRRRGRRRRSQMLEDLGARIEEIALADMDAAYTRRHDHHRGRGRRLPCRRSARASRDVQRRAARRASSSAASTGRPTTCRRSACGAI